MRTYYVVAVDFDGTLVHNAFPEIGKPYNAVIAKLNYHIQELKMLYESVIVVLWTCREDNPERAYLTEAVEECKKIGVHIDYANECPIISFKSRKLCADEYWDDRAVNPTV